MQINANTIKEITFMVQKEHKCYKKSIFYNEHCVNIVCPNCNETNDIKKLYREIIYTIISKSDSTYENVGLMLRFLSLNDCNKRTNC